MDDNLQRRHRLIIESIRSKPTKRWTVQDIAKVTELSPKTVANEMPMVLRLDTEIQRSVRTNVYRYYVGKPEQATTQPSSTLSVTANGATYVGSDPLNQIDVKQIFDAATKPNYVSVPARLGWKLSLAMAQLVSSALSGETRYLTGARQAVEELEAITAQYLVNLQRLLSTETLWADPAWLTQGMPEDLLENLGEASRQTLERLAKLETSKQTHQEQKESP